MDAREPGASAAVPDYEAEYAPFVVPLRETGEVTARQANLLAKLEVHTRLDLIRHVPRSYEDWTQLTPIAELRDGEEQVFRATIQSAPTLFRRGRRATVRAVLSDETATIRAIWFNQPWLAENLRSGTSAVFRGRVRRDGGRFEVVSPAIDALGDGNAAQVAYLHPVYPLTAGLRQVQLRRLIAAQLGAYAERIPEALPPALRQAHGLCDVSYAYRVIHEPPDGQQLETARRRLAFEELFMVQTGLALLRLQAETREAAIALRLDDEAMARYRALVEQLPFTPTGAQMRVTNEIYRDLTRTRPMSRLVQGDVGSGKTLVAALAMYQAVLCGYQATLMAPTAVLAAQHERTLTELLGAHVRVALLTGAMSAGERRSTLAAIRRGEVDIVVGTHAVIEDRVVFARLALAVTDEQHRFGVRQRMRLASDSRAGTREASPLEQLAGAEPEAAEAEEGTGLTPHVLVMSATPIPRTLGLILYGDLDISRIDEMPAGRQPIQTYTVDDEALERAYRLIQRELDAGAQAFVVCPTIRAGEDEGRLSAEQTFARLSEGPFADYRVGLLHGDQKARDKTAAMDAFMSGETQLLVSTTVIEVGIDQPNATVMLIMNADRFGLAQLHQLRGRIGRGSRASYCLLHSDREEEVARARLRVLCQTMDGFQIAEADLQMRGPGDFFGTRQHGVPSFHIANLYEDSALLAESHEASRRLLEDDPQLRRPEHRRIRPALYQLFGLDQAQMGL